MPAIHRFALGLITGALISPLAQAANGEATYKTICSACHATGASGSPKLGDKTAWGPRVAEGQAILTAHAYVGQGAMPPKGGKPDLALEDFGSAVVFMANQAGAKWRDPDAKQIQAIRGEIVKREKELAEKRKK